MTFSPRNSQAIPAIALAMVAVVSALALSPARPARQVAKSLFFDDFSGNALDRSKWTVRITGQTVNDEQQAYIDSPDTLYIARGAQAEGAQNGALSIHPRYRLGHRTPEGRKFDFVSGRLDTKGKFEFTYGTASARMKLPAGEGFWPAFWALGGGEWPDTGEIDIMENVGEPDWTSIALHGPKYFGETPLVNRVYFPPGKDIMGWHVYSVEWSRDALLFRIDGALAYRATRPMVEHFGRWAFDNPKYLILNLALGGAYPEKTSGVRKPFFGLPQSTVDAIKSEKPRVMVDWVRVTGS